jgi:hypothetical protein
MLAADNSQKDTIMGSIFGLALLHACGEKEQGTDDQEIVDAGIVDAGIFDAGNADTGSVDAAEVEVDAEGNPVEFNEGDGIHSAAFTLGEDVFILQAFSGSQTFSIKSACGISNGFWSLDSKGKLPTRVVIGDWDNNGQQEARIFLEEGAVEYLEWQHVSSAECALTEEDVSPKSKTEKRVKEALADLNIENLKRVFQDKEISSDEQREFVFALANRIPTDTSPEVIVKLCELIAIELVKYDEGVDAPLTRWLNICADVALNESLPESIRVEAYLALSRLTNDRLSEKLRSLAKGNARNAVISLARSSNISIFRRLYSTKSEFISKDGEYMSLLLGIVATENPSHINELNDLSDDDSSIYDEKRDQNATCVLGAAELVLKSGTTEQKNTALDKLQELAFDPAVNPEVRVECARLLEINGRNHSAQIVYKQLMQPDIAKISIDAFVTANNIGEPAQKSREYVERIADRMRVKVSEYQYVQGKKVEDAALAKVEDIGRCFSVAKKLLQEDPERGNAMFARLITSRHPYEFDVAKGPLAYRAEESVTAIFDYWLAHGDPSAAWAAIDTEFAEAMTGDGKHEPYRYNAYAEIAYEHGKEEKAKSYIEYSIANHFPYYFSVRVFSGDFDAELSARFNQTLEKSYEQITYDLTSRDQKIEHLGAFGLALVYFASKGELAQVHRFIEWIDEECKSLNEMEKRNDLRHEPEYQLYSSMRQIRFRDEATRTEVRAMKKQAAENLKACGNPKLQKYGEIIEKYSH